jgi:hypothetical protein
MGHGAASCGATASGAATTAAAPGAVGFATGHVGPNSVTACGARESGAARLRRQAEWRGKAAAPLRVARHVCVQHPTQQAWDSLSQNFQKFTFHSSTLNYPEIHKRGVQKLQIHQNDKICK